jgi:hypothetical protein
MKDEESEESEELSRPAADCIAPWQARFTLAHGLGWCDGDSGDMVGSMTYGRENDRLSGVRNQR